ncbi:MAG: hypothetical protein QOJ05_1939 [Verrucomicrobiota bacterium]
MTNPCSIAFMGVVVAVWLALFIQSHRLFYKFRATFPDVARRDIPHAFDFSRHPEKIRYFFRRTSIPILQSDGELWRLRQQVKLLGILALIVPPAGMLLLVAVGILLAQLTNA